MNEIETRLDRVIGLLEDLSRTQQDMHLRQQKLFRIYAWSAGLVWLIFGGIFVLILVVILASSL